MGTKRRELRNQITKIEKELEALDKDIEKMPGKELELTRLNREADAKREVYTTLLQKYQEAKIAESMHSKNLNIIDFSTPPSKPISPDHRKNIIFGMLFSILIGIISSILIEIFDLTINTPDEVKNLTDIPLIGVIPKWSETKSKFSYIKNLITNKHKRMPLKPENYLKVGKEPKSPIAEAFRTIRTNIKSLSVDKKFKTILITSSTLQEGKTTISTNLALAFAQSNKKTVIIDTDLRRPIIHKIFKIKSSPGVTDICIEKTPIKNALFKTDFDNLFVIPHGKSIPNPAELLDSEKFSDFTSKLEKDFEIIIFDAPPVLAVTDPIIISNYSDINIFVIRSEISLANTARLALDNLQTANVRIDGIILNDIDLIRQYGSYRYSYYYYSEDAR
jgi:tyrosine-protein kinase Etk/Wzc